MKNINGFPNARTILTEVVFAIVATCPLAGCSLSSLIADSSIDYNTTIEDVSNTSLVINVLRGRDSAPLYFPDLSQVRGSLAGSASLQATLPFGEIFGSNARRSLQGGPLSATTNPTFDIAPTNTKQFYQGLLNPVSQDLFDYFINRDRAGSVEWVFHLLVNSIEIYNKHDGSRTVIAWRDPFDSFVRIADRWTEGTYPPVLAQAPDKLKPLGPPLNADAKAIVAANSAGLEISDAGRGRVQFSKKITGPIICFYDGPDTGYVPISVQHNSVVKTPAGEANPESAEANTPYAKQTNDCPGPHRLPQQLQYTLQLRSVEQVFNYLGTLVASDDQQNTIRKSGKHQGCPRIPFYILSQPVAHARFSVSYRGETYYVAGTERKDGCGPGGIVDNTMPILAIVNDLLNLNRDANEIPTTKAVQAVGGG